MLLRMLVFWTVTLCSWIIVSSLTSQPLTIKTAFSFEEMGRYKPVT
jgi:hypothetical protein